MFSGFPEQFRGEVGVFSDGLGGGEALKYPFAFATGEFVAVVFEPEDDDGEVEPCGFGGVFFGVGVGGVFEVLEGVGFFLAGREECFPTGVEPFDVFCGEGFVAADEFQVGGRGEEVVVFCLGVVVEADKF